MFTCSKLKIETLERGVKYVQIKTYIDAIGVVLVSLLLTLNIFQHFHSVSLVNFEYAITDLLVYRKKLKFRTAPAKELIPMNFRLQFKTIERQESAETYFESR